MGGTAAEFQIPPRPARLPSVASPGSARAAKAATPAGSEPSPAAPDTKVATNHGEAATRNSPIVPQTRRMAEVRPPGVATTTSAAVRASRAPVGVRPANASDAADAHQDPGVARRTPIPAHTIHGSAA